MRGLERRFKHIAAPLSRLGLAPGVLLGLLLGPLGSAAHATELLDALSVGDCDIATLQAGAATTEGERLGVARCYVRTGQPARATALLSALRGGPLDPYARLVEAEAKLAAGDATGAAAALEGVTLTGAAADRAASIRGRALVEAGRYDEARDVLRPLLESALGEAGQLADPWGADPAEVRWWLAEGAVRRGDAERALPVWRALWTRNPTSARADEAAKRLAAAGHPVPDPSTDAGRALMQERIKTLSKLQLYAEALALRDQLPGQTDRGLARAAFQARDYPRAAAAFSRISDRSPDEQFDYALATSRAGDYERAAALYRELYDKYPSNSKADFASFKVAYLAYDAADLERAVGLFRDHLGRYPSSEHADEARWFIGWSLVRLGRLDDARAALDTLVQRHPGAGLADAGRYWLARLKGMSGDATGETEGLTALLRARPDSGYAWYASARLGKRYPRPAAVKPAAPPASLTTEAWRRGVALSEAGLDGWARAELSGLIGAARSGGRASSLAMAAALIDAGDFVGAQQLARPHCAPAWKGGAPDAAQACYPRPSARLVRRLTTEMALDPNLPFAIMNAESGLKPWVTSPAGARGLMQLMPAIGAVAHERRFPGRAFDPDALYLPAYNAALGTTELGMLRARFDSSGATPGLPLVIAGYNGGPDAVERWLAADPRSSQGDWFAENIGFTETRQYVRRVLGFIQTYRYVYGDD